MPTELRPCSFTFVEYVRPGERYTRVGHGLFHGWGVDFEEFETGPGNFSVAIIELPDGKIKTVKADAVTFERR